MALLEVNYSKNPTIGDGDGLELLEHPNLTGLVQIDPEKISRMSALKKGEKYIMGEDALKRLRLETRKNGKILLDARFLEELILHPELIPDDWNNDYTFFFGSVFTDEFKNRLVPALYKVGNSCMCEFYSLKEIWFPKEPIACLETNG